MNPTPTSALPSPDASSPIRLRAVGLREPLLHFAILGALLFAVDHFIVSRQDDPSVIRMDAAVDKQTRDVFAASRGRPPDAAELAALRQVWLDNEVLYREGLAMSVDKGDDAIRERVIFKALSIVDANVRISEPDEATLRSFFERHRDKYDEPARYDFEEAVLSGERSEAAVREFVAQLNSGTSGDANAGLRVFKGRPRANLVQSYGEAFPTELEQQASPAHWRAIDTRDGWRAVHLLSMTPAKAAQFEVVAPLVLQDWRDQVGAEQRSAAVRALAKKYRIVSEPDAS